jgi:hypothetical protein
MEGALFCVLMGNELRADIAEHPFRRVGEHI